MKINANTAASKARENLKTQENYYKRLRILLVVMGTLAVLSATSPFWHIFFPKSSEEKFILFRNIRSFLYAFGTHFCVLGLSSFTMTISNFIDSKYSRLGKIVHTIGSLFFAISIYFLAWCFRSSIDYPKWMYEITFIVSAIVATLMFSLFIRALFESYIFQRASIKELILLAFRIRDKHYIEVAVKAKFAERYNKALPDTKTIKQHADELDKDIDNTINQ